MRKCILIGLVLIGLLYVPKVNAQTAFGPSSALCWIPPAGTILGYKVYFGTVTKTYAAAIDVGLNQKLDTTLGIPGLICMKLSNIGGLLSGNIFVVVTAYNTSGESIKSGEYTFLYLATPPTTILPTTLPTTTTSTLPSVTTTTLPLTTTTTSTPITTSTVKTTTTTTTLRLQAPSAPNGVTGKE